ncbi:Uncharacterised protein [Vibrio cholerae]|nr:Uncharacterised protein [Vibrio cholerae]
MHIPLSLSESYLLAQCLVLELVSVQEPYPLLRQASLQTL